MKETLRPDQADRLAHAARSGDAAALAQIYESYGPPMLGFLHHLLQDRGAAEDILHDTFVRLFEGRGNWQSNGKLKPWLFTVARRLAVDRMRTVQRHHELAEQIDVTTIMGSSAALETDHHSTELTNLVSRTLSTLPPAYATVFHLRIGQDFTYAEIAAICNEPEGTLRSRVHRTLDLLRQAAGQVNNSLSKGKEK